jgi:parvulin-like peptidyl-prolyl isomerase
VLFVSLCLSVSSTLFSQDTRVIASTKDWSITAQQFDQFLELLPDQQHQYFSAHRREFLDQLIRIWVMAADARAQGLDKTPKFRATVDFYSNNMLAGELHRRQTTGAATISDEAVRGFYEKNKAEFTQIRLAHILALNAGNPDSRKRIEEARSKLRGGATFEDVAKEYSQDTENAAKGGDLGYVSKGRMPPDMEAVVLALKEGTLSDTFESPIGLHIFRATEVKVAPLSEVSSEIRQKLEADQFNAQVDAKIKAADVKIDESFF